MECSTFPVCYNQRTSVMRTQSTQSESVNHLRQSNSSANAMTYMLEVGQHLSYFLAKEVVKLVLNFISESVFSKIVNRSVFRVRVLLDVSWVNGNWLFSDNHGMTTDNLLLGGKTYHLFQEYIYTNISRAYGICSFYSSASADTEDSLFLICMTKQHTYCGHSYHTRKLVILNPNGHAFVYECEFKARNDSFKICASASLIYIAYNCERDHLTSRIAMFDTETRKSCKDLEWSSANTVQDMQAHEGILYILCGYEGITRLDLVTNQRLLSVPFSSIMPYSFNVIGNSFDKLNILIYARTQKSTQLFKIDLEGCIIQGIDIFPITDTQMRYDLQIESINYKRGQLVLHCIHNEGHHRGYQYVTEIVKLDTDMYTNQAKT